MKQEAFIFPSLPIRRPAASNIKIKKKEIERNREREERAEKEERRSEPR